MSANKEWPELVGKTFDEASKVIRQYDDSKTNQNRKKNKVLSDIDCFHTDLNPYNAPNGIENRMFDPHRVVCVTDGNGIVTKAPSYQCRK